MFSKTERLLAFRYLRSRKRTGFVSVIAGFSFLGIMLGVATLIIVMSVMNGFKAELMDKVLGLNGQMGIYPEWGDKLGGYQDKAKVLSQLSEIKDIIPVIDSQVMASTPNTSSGVLVRGMRAEDFENRTILKDNYIGEPLSEFTEGNVILGYRLAHRLGVRRGQKITLLSPKGNITAFGTIPKMKSYRVIGTFNTSMFQYDDNYIFMPIQEAQTFFQMGDTVSHLEVFVSDAHKLDSVIKEAMGVIGTDALVYDWRHTNQAFFDAIEVERNVMFLILTLIIIVAAFNMISGLIMLVQDKSKDIAILRTMGLSRGGIQRVFLMSGLMVGFVGTLAGVILGLAFSYNIDSIKNWLEGLSGQTLFSAEIYFLSHLPAKVDLNEVLIVAVMSLALSLLATLYPSWKAGRTDPVEALRYE
ncbi:MAG: lipoprotein-releasing ABC transporter permease subunit [Alphaproteobacteria bacterium]|nr:lipoprotein-releasing ABC transporter permease subunit [Alphaproteobacteria bacterium]